MVFRWSLSDSKSPQVSRTLLSILAVLNNAVIWMVSTRPPTSKSSSPFSNPLVTVPNAPITIGIIIIIIIVITSSCSSSISPGKIHKTAIFWVIISRFGLLVWIRRSIWISKFRRILCVSFSMIDSCL